MWYKRSRFWFGSKTIILYKFVMTSNIVVNKQNVKERELKKREFNVIG